MPILIPENPEIDLSYPFDKKLNARLNLFWSGFLLYTAAYTVGAGLNQAYSVTVFAQAIGILLFTVAAVNLIRFRFDNKYIRDLFSIYCIWLLFVVARGISFSVFGIKYILFDGAFGLFVYFSPLILLFPIDLEFIRKLFNIIAIAGILYIIYDICFAKILLSSDRTPNLVNQNAAERFTKYLSIPVGFLLFTFNYHSRKRRMLAVFVILINLLLTIYRARRGLTLICSVTILFAFLIYIGSSRIKFLMIIVSLIAGFFVYSIVATYTTGNQNNPLFGFMLERSEEDTRTPVEDCLYADMTTKDWIIGKGLLGIYYCPDIDYEDVSGYRDSIETDYLNIILKGGIVSLALVLLMAIPAVIKGLFYSKNTLSKAAAFWILLWLISLYPSNVSTFSLNYLLVWISIGICHARKLRDIPDESLIAYFRNEA